MVEPGGPCWEAVPGWARYPAYQDSGIEWLGQIPVGWETRRLKHLVEFKSGGTPEKSNSEYWSGDIPWVSPKDMRTRLISDTIDHISSEALHATTLVDECTVLIVVRSGVLRHTIPVAVTQRTVALNQDLKALVTRGNILPDYLRYFIEGMNEFLLVEWRKEGTTVESLETDSMASTPIPLPPYSDQRVISHFLDCEMVKVDALVTKQQELICLLQEKRSALIDRAVTKGLDPDVAMKDSGVEWLREIPAHWEVKKLKRSVAVTGGMTPSMDVGAYWNGSIPWVTPKDMKAEAIHDSAIRVTEAAVRETPLAVVESGAVLMVVRGMILAKAVPVAWTTCPVTINQDMKALRPVSAINGQFLARSLTATCDALLSLVDVTGHGSRRLPTDRYLALPLAVPSQTEQQLILDYIRESTAALAATAKRARRAIELLREYRAALISAAVTGKIDVRDHLHADTTPHPAP